MSATAINIHDAKTQFSRLVERASAGESIIIAKAGTPVAKLVPLDAAPRKSRIGSLKGQFTVPDDFMTMMEDEIIAMFEGEDEDIV